MRHRYEFVADGDDGVYDVLDADGHAVARCKSEDVASDVCAALNRECDAQLILDTFINKAVDAVEKYGLSSVPHAGSLKSDEAWEVIGILGREIDRLRDQNAKLFRRARFENVGGDLNHLVFLQCQTCGKQYVVTGEKYREGTFDSDGEGPKDTPLNHHPEKR